MDKSAILSALRQVVGNENCSDDLGLRELFSQDIWAKGETADFVISPRNTAQLAQAVAIAATLKTALHPRGGGMSYTKGYIPDRPNSGIIDFSRMDEILEINAEDMYVTVQAGCTWKTLYEALKPLGVRTPFWGPLSGISSTIGGGLSQNNVFFGAGTHGPSTESVTALKVVLSDGTIVETGAGGTTNGKPFWRPYGPDLTGLFLSDTGALGFKAEATLRLIPLPQSEDWLSFEFGDYGSWVDAMVAMGRLGLACELFGFDPNLQRVRMERASLAADLKTLGNVVTGQKSGLLKGIKEGAKIAMAGRRYMDNVAYSMHLAVEGHSAPEVAEKIKTLGKLAIDHGGSEIENSIPKIMRANPFGPLNTILGPKGQRWAPIHGILPLSDAAKCQAEIEDLFAEMAADFEQFEIIPGQLLTTVSTHAFVIEPVFIWPEEIWPIHEQTVEASTLKRVQRFEKNPDATACVEKAREGVLDIFEKYGAAHLQIGRTYRFKQTRKDETWKLLQAIKSVLDPDNQVNPGSLGL